MSRSWHIWQNRVRIDDTHLGKALFALRRFRKEQVIGVIQGKIIDDADYGSLYCMDLGGTRSLEPIEPFRFLNHSCEANCELFSWEYGEHHQPLPTQLFLSATRTILPGEELTIDYAWSADAAIPCLCGSQKCRGWVVDESQLELLAMAK